jgi:cytochrome c-type biogenesis protein CcmH/NrfF
VNPVDILPYLTGAGGALFALALGITLIITGVLVPRAYHQRLQEENQKLRETAETLRETVRMAQEQNMQLANSAQVTIQLMKVLDAIAREKNAGPPGPPSVTGTAP